MSSSRYHTRSVSAENNVTEAPIQKKQKTQTTQAAVASSSNSYNGRFLKAQLLWQQQVADLLDRVVEPCNVSSYISELSTVDKDSASDSLVLFGRIPASAEILDLVDAKDQVDFDQVSAKVSFPSTDAMFNGLDAERTILRQDFHYLFQNGFTQNIVAFLGDVMCEGELNVGAKAAASYRSILAKVRPKISATTPAHLLIMERGTRSLSSWFTMINSSDEECMQVIMQCYYVLACLKRLNIRHNDLGFQNILIRELAVPEDIVLRIPVNDALDASTREIRLTTRYLVKMFDMDRGASYSRHVFRNEENDFCDLDWREGQCNGLPQLFDTAAFNFSAVKHLQVTRRSEKVVAFMATQFGGILTFRVLEPRVEDRASVYHCMTRQEKRQVRTPIQSMNAAIDEFELALNADRPYEIAPFSLPAQRVVRIDRPLKSMLGELVHYKEVEQLPALELPRATKPAVISDAFTFQQLIQIKLQGSGQWYRILNLWKRELHEDSKGTYHWNLIALELYQQLQLRTANACDALVFQYACLLLTCPMYYGLEEKIRDQFIKPFADPMQVKRAELVVWRTFDNTLPISIPLLYDLSPPEPRRHTDVIASLLDFIGL